MNFTIVGEWGVPVMLERPPGSCGYPLYSLSFFCPVCRREWGNIDIEGDVVFVPQMVSCIECKWSDDLHPIPGSILVNDTFPDAVDWELMDIIPSVLLEREAKLHLEALCRQNALDIGSAGGEGSGISSTDTLMCESLSATSEKRPSASATP